MSEAVTSSPGNGRPIRNHVSGSHWKTAMGKSTGLRGLIPIILSKPEVLKMRFTCGTRNLNSVDLSQFSDGLRKVKIHIHAAPTKLGPPVVAQYRPRRHTFIFSSPFFGQNV